MNLLLIDVGGTWTRLARSDGRQLKKIIRIPTSKEWKRAKLDWIAVTAELFANRKVEGVTIGLPGLLDRQHRTLIGSGNISKWERKPIYREARRIFRAPVVLENDAALAALGEAVYGAGQKQEIVGYLTIGTGVGGARIVHRSIDRRAAGFEPGHQVIRQYRGRAQTLEDLVSGANIRRRFGKKAEHLKNQKIWKLLAEELALGIVNVVDLWSPDIVLLGGGVMPAYRRHLPLMRRVIRKQRSPMSVPKVIFGRLGDRAGLYGALALSTRKTSRI